ncbi:hypothetical protein OSB04_012559 [Centaurea solstitialis]|uniref:Uncharacterized protein n=1 Tax=Centaurea solstitialis TaxID=347529 RepID=A0AA38WMJ4_9ASTR|nr:hypothetical protein OSB04_012559 [Centaurea solstitialis]
MLQPASFRFLQRKYEVLSNVYCLSSVGIRLGKITSSVSSHQEFIKAVHDLNFAHVLQNSPIDRSNQDHGSLAKTVEVSPGTTINMRRLSSRLVTKNSHHNNWLPKIHEDYYGPKVHPPRHH